jgi:ElaB/YqjD/DUF883 family membrane-anchored ribosome-binding protein
MNPINTPGSSEIGNGRTTTMSDAATSTTHTQAARANLGEAGEHLKQAAHLAGNTARSAAESARSELRSGGHAVGEELSEAALASKRAAAEARDVADEQMQAAISRGRALLQSAEALIRERPLASLGVAVLAGVLIARIGRH